MISPLDVHRHDPSDQSEYGKSLPRALEWRKRLMAVAGPPGKRRDADQP